MICTSPILASYADAVRRDVRLIQNRYARKRGAGSHTADEIIGYDSMGFPLIVVDTLCVDRGPNSVAP